MNYPKRKSQLNMRPQSMNNENEFECNLELEKTPAYKKARERAERAYHTLAIIYNLEKDIYTNEYIETIDFQIAYVKATNRICFELGICLVEFEHNSIYMPIG